jgi:hypothetical protein
VTGWSDPSAAPPALPKIFNGNAVKRQQQCQQNASLWDKSNLSHCGLFFFVPRDESGFERSLDNICVADFRRFHQGERLWDRYIQSQEAVH